MFQIQKVINSISLLAQTNKKPSRYEYLLSKLLNPMKLLLMSHKSGSKWNNVKYISKSRYLGAAKYADLCHFQLNFNTDNII